MVGNADLSEDGRAHQLEEAKGSLAIPVTLEIHPPLRQNLMLGILYGAVFLNVGINQLVQISSVSPELFRIAVCLAARKYCRDYKRRMSEKRVLHVRLVCYFVFWPVEDLPYKLLVRERARKLPYRDFFEIGG